MLVLSAVLCSDCSKAKCSKVPSRRVNALNSFGFSSCFSITAVACTKDWLSPQWIKAANLSLTSSFTVKIGIAPLPDGTVVVLVMSSSPTDNGELGNSMLMPVVSLRPWTAWACQRIDNRRGVSERPQDKNQKTMRGTHNLTRIDRAGIRSGYAKPSPSRMAVQSCREY